MKNLLILLFIFLSFNSFSQGFKTDPARESLLSNEYVRKAESNILALVYDWKTDTTIAFKEIRENALKAAKNDTLLLFSSGSMGYNSRKGAGEYDSITLKYSFLYDDIYTDCVVTEDFELGIEIHNTIIEDEISKRYGKEWKAQCKAEIEKARNQRNIETGRRVDFKLLMNQVEVDTIFMNNFEKLQIDISNEEVVNQVGKRKFVATISFVKDRKLIKQYENIYSEDIESILIEELSKRENGLDRVVIEFRNLYYLLGLYVYPIK